MTISSGRRATKPGRSTSLLRRGKRRRARARSLDVDGLVHVQRYVAPPWTTGQAIGNVFLMNVPLVLALRAVNLRISIIESRSGEVVWRRELKGQETERDTPADIPAALGDLDNAVPRRLR